MKCWTCPDPVEKPERSPFCSTDCKRTWERRQEAAKKAHAKGDFSGQKKIIWDPRYLETDFRSHPDWTLHLIALSLAEGSPRTFLADRSEKARARQIAGKMEGKKKTGNAQNMDAIISLAKVIRRYEIKQIALASMKIRLRQYNESQDQSDFAAFVHKHLECIPGNHSDKEIRDATKLLAKCYFLFGYLAGDRILDTREKATIFYNVLKRNLGMQDPRCLKDPRIVKALAERKRKRVSES
jgi:hypothetical protein